MANNDTIKIPVTAHMRIIDGKAIMVDAEYLEVSADAVARFLMDAFHVQYETGR